MTITTKQSTQHQDIGTALPQQAQQHTLQLIRKRILWPSSPVLIEARGQFNRRVASRLRVWTRVAIMSLAIAAILFAPTMAAVSIAVSVAISISIMTSTFVVVVIVIVVIMVVSAFASLPVSCWLGFGRWITRNSLLLRFQVKLYSLLTSCRWASWLYNFARGRLIVIYYTILSSG